jgi:hypothetical protein
MTEAELISKIASSDSFQASEQLGPLLDFIYQRQVIGRKTLARDIETDHFKRVESSLQAKTLARAGWCTKGISWTLLQ